MNKDMDLEMSITGKKLYASFYQVQKCPTSELFQMTSRGQIL